MFDSGIGIRDPLFFIGVVERNDDPQLEGRVQVRAFSVHGTNKEVPTPSLPWAVCASGSYDPNCPPPPLNSFVYGLFLDGRDAQHPMVLGLIPTQFAEPIDPEKNGWGVIPNRDGYILAKGSTPRDYGQPQQSRLARGESIEETYVIAQEMGRVEKVKIAGEEDITWDEPGPAYAAKYPFNRVIETAKHSIEIDDTPGGERIMIRHKEGSYVQIDAKGNTTHKSVGDKFEVNDEQQHVYVGGHSIIHVHGDSRVYTHGNKIEEVNGDYQLIVHGNAMFGVGGQMNLNASEQIQARGADVKIEANVSTMALYAKKDMQIGSGIAINVTAKNMYTDMSNLYHVYSENELRLLTKNMFQEATQADGDGFNIKSATGIQIGSDSKISLDAPLVAADDIIQLANSLADIPADASTTAATPAAKTVIPEPPAKSTSIFNGIIASSDSVGFLSTDDDADPSFGVQAASLTRAANTPSLEKANAMKPMLDIIGAAESTGYDDIENSINENSLGGRKISEMSIQEVLDWQSALPGNTAAGRYQFINSTLQYLVDSGDLDPNATFTPEQQDLAAIAIMERQGKLNAYMNGEISREKFADNLATIWAGLPEVIGKDRGKSKYSGVQSNAARTDVNSVLSGLQQFEENYNQIASSRYEIFKGLTST